MSKRLFFNRTPYKQAFHYILNASPHKKTPTNFNGTSSKLVDVFLFDGTPNHCPLTFRLQAADIARGLPLDLIP